MLTNKAVTVAVLTALTGQAAAFNSHRHLHREVEKRALETDWVTEWKTVYVTEGQEPQPTGDAVAEGQGNPQGSPQENYQVPEAPQPTTTSTTTSIVVKPTEEAVAEIPEPVAAAPQPTTLATSVKPAAPSAPPAQEPEPIVEISASIDLPVIPAPTTKEPETPKPSSNPSPPAGGAPSSKRGIAFNDANMANIFSSACESCGWAYSWGSSRGDLSEDIEFVPTLWGDADEHTSHWDVNCQESIDSGSKAVFSFNEPDHVEQANLSPSQAAASHAKWLNPYSGKVLVGAPSVTNSGEPGQGLEWLQGFMDACDAQEGGCAIDFCNVHWYSEAAYADTLFEHLEKAHEICGGKPVWLTEFAPLGSDEDKASFIQEIVPQLDEVEYLDAYSYFMVSEGELMSSLSSLSTAGQLYATV